MSQVYGLDHVLLRGAVANTLQTALKEQLDRDPGAVPAFVAGLRHYLQQPLRLKRLLQPCVGPEQPAAAVEPASQQPSEPTGAKQPQQEVAPAEQHDAGDTAADQVAAADAASVEPSADQPVGDGNCKPPLVEQGSTSGATDASATSSAPLESGKDGDAPCLLSVLTGVAPLRPALVDLLMDTMVAACQQGRGNGRDPVSCAGAGGVAQPSLASAVATGAPCRNFRGEAVRLHLQSISCCLAVASQYLHWLILHTALLRQVSVGGERWFVL